MRFLCQFVVFLMFLRKDNNFKQFVVEQIVLTPISTKKTTVGSVIWGQFKTTAQLHKLFCTSCI